MDIKQDIKAESKELKTGVHLISIAHNGVIVKRRYTAKEITPATLESIKDHVLYDMLCTHDEINLVSFEEQRQDYDYLTFGEMKSAYLQDFRLNNKLLAMFSGSEIEQLYSYFGC